MVQVSILPILNEPPIINDLNVNNNFNNNNISESSLNDHFISTQITVAETSNFVMNNDLDLNNDLNFNTVAETSVINIESEYNLISSNILDGELLYSQPLVQQIPLAETILVRAFNIEIKIKDTDSLSTNNNSDKLLNDNIIDFYFNMIKSLKYNKKLANDINILSSFEFKRFLKDKDYLKKDRNRINIFNHSYILVPICHFDHWSLVNIHVKDKKVRYFDSLVSLKTNDERKKVIKEFISKIIVHDSSKINFTTDILEWGFRVESMLPQQTNNYDCGIFICLFAKIISYNLKISPSQFLNEYISEYRLRILEEIRKVELLDNDFTYASQFGKKNI